MTFQPSSDTLADLVSRFYPIGSVVIRADALDPATLFGGVWTVIGAGRVLVGQDTGDAAFDVLGETGGAKDVTLTAAQSGLPQHTHVQDAHTHVQNAHSHVENIASSATGGLVGSTPDASTNASVASGYSTANATAVNQNATAVNQNAGPTAASQAHSNLQPYLVVKFWQRTG